jgi:hypothetical protein
MPSPLARLRREVGVDVEEARAGNVAGEVELTPARGIAELPAAVDELVAQGYRYQLEDGRT